MKRVTANNIQEHVANEVIAYLDADIHLQLKRIKHSIEAIKKLALHHLDFERDKCLSCNVWYLNDDERRNGIKCQDPECPDKFNSSCGRFNCQPILCSKCQIPICLSCDCGSIGCYRHDCVLVGCSNCAKKLRCQGCELSDGGNFACENHPVRKYTWKPGQEILACDQCIDFWETDFPDKLDREDWRNV